MIKKILHPEFPVKETVIDVPHYKRLVLRHVVLDYNGTLAKDGKLKKKAKKLLRLLTENYRVHVITADTFGSVQAQLEGFDVTVKVLHSADHSAEKADYAKALSAASCAAVGNGNNDAEMLRDAELGIALMGDEGCSTRTLLNSDIVCKSIGDALELLLNEKRLIATLRK
jgi:P-type E1-E2 ATPase